MGGVRKSEGREKPVDRDRHDDYITELDGKLTNFFRIVQYEKYGLSKPDFHKDWKRLKESIAYAKEHLGKRKNYQALERRLNEIERRVFIPLHEIPKLERKEWTLPKTLDDEVCDAADVHLERIALLKGKSLQNKAQAFRDVFQKGPLFLGRGERHPGVKKHEELMIKWLKFLKEAPNDSKELHQRVEDKFIKPLKDLSIGKW